MAKATTNQSKEPAANVKTCNSKEKTKVVPKDQAHVPKDQAHVPKAGPRNKRQASDGTDDDSTSNEEVPVACRRKKGKPSPEVVDEEVDDDFDEPEVEEVEGGDNGPTLGEESNEVP
jgi:hypothetical protein